MLELTDEEIEVTMRWMVTKMMEAGITLTNPEQVLRWVILNPIPDAATVTEEYEAAEVIEKQRRIAVLTKELKRLEGN